MRVIILILSILSLNLSANDIVELKDHSKSLSQDGVIGHSYVINHQVVIENPELTCDDITEKARAALIDIWNVRSNSVYDYAIVCMFKNLIVQIMLEPTRIHNINWINNYLAEIKEMDLFGAYPTIKQINSLKVRTTFNASIFETQKEYWFKQTYLSEYENLNQYFIYKENERLVFRNNNYNYFYNYMKDKLPNEHDELKYVLKTYDEISQNFEYSLILDDEIRPGMWIDGVFRILK